MSESNATKFRREQRRFAQLCHEVVARNPGFDHCNASPKRLLAFVEALLLCPDEAAARAHIARDQEAAEFFRIRSGDVARAFDVENALSVIESPPHQTPFYFVAAALLKSAQLSAQQLGDDWKPAQQ
jgi:hypothetical protein